MTLPINLPQFQAPSDEYSRDYMEQLKQSMEYALSAMNAKGPIVASKIMVTTMPSSGYGLRAGETFEQNGVVYIVRAKDIFFSPVGAAVAGLGAVTTSP